MDQLIFMLAGLSGLSAYFTIFFLLLLCGFGLPLPEDISLFASGLLVYYGNADLWTMIAVCFFGVMAGDSAVFYLGHHYGSRLIRRKFWSKLLHADRMEEVKATLHRRGNIIFFLARFMPGLRAPIFFSAGTLKVPFWVFFIFDGLAALISVPTIVYFTWFFGSKIHQVIAFFRATNQGILIAIGSVILLLIANWAWRNYRRNSKLPKA